MRFLTIPAMRRIQVRKYPAFLSLLKTQSLNLGCMLLVVADVDVDIFAVDYGADNDDEVMLELLCAQCGPRRRRS